MSLRSAQQRQRRFSANVDRRSKPLAFALTRLFDTIIDEEIELAKLGGRLRIQKVSVDQVKAAVFRVIAETGRAPTDFITTRVALELFVDIDASPDKQRAQEKKARARVRRTINAMAQRGEIIDTKFESRRSTRTWSAPGDEGVKGTIRQASNSAINRAGATMAKELKTTYTPATEAARRFLASKDVRVTEFLRQGRNDISVAIRESLGRATVGQISASQVAIIADLKATLANKGTFSFSRANTIARTEMAQAENFGIQEGMKQAGVREIQWITNLDGNERPDHQEMHGTTTRIGEPFVLPDGSQLRFPADPEGPPEQIINCRCTTAPVRRS